MGTERPVCLKCGHVFEGTRIQQQRVRQRTVRLEWASCSRCHNVALVSWRWEEQEQPTEGLGGRPPECK